MLCILNLKKVKASRSPATGRVAAGGGYRMMMMIEFQKARMMRVSHHSLGFSNISKSVNETRRDLVFL